MRTSCELWVAAFSGNAPRSQHLNKNVFNSRLNHQCQLVAVQLEDCSAGSDRQLQKTCLYSCRRSCRSFFAKNVIVVVNTPSASEQLFDVGRHTAVVHLSAELRTLITAVSAAGPGMGPAQHRSPDVAVAATWPALSCSPIHPRSITLHAANVAFSHALKRRDN